MALKFLNKKGWHTGSLRNIENVWKAEQKHEAEQKKLDELRKQILEERERSEFRQLQEQAGLVPRQERLDFLYDSGLSVGRSDGAASASTSASGSGFKALEQPSSASGNQQSSVPGALFDDKPYSASDAWRKLHSDPLLLIRQREQEALARVKNNPIKMALIRKSAEEKKGKAKKKHKDRSGGKKERAKKHRSSSKHSSSGQHSDSEYATSSKGERQGKIRNHNSSHPEEERLCNRRSDSGDESTERTRSKKDRYKDSKYREQSASGFSEPKNKKSDDRDSMKMNHDRSKLEKYPSEDRGNNYDAQSKSSYGSAPENRSDSHYKRRYGAPKLSEEELAARLHEMQANAELHEEQRWKRLKKAEEDDAREATRDRISRGKNFLDAAQKSVYGAEKGGSSTIEERVRRRTYYSQGQDLVNHNLIKMGCISSKVVSRSTSFREQLNLLQKKADGITCSRSGAYQPLSGSFASESNSCLKAGVDLGKTETSETWELTSNLEQEEGKQMQPPSPLLIKATESIDADSAIRSKSCHLFQNQEVTPHPLERSDEIKEERSIRSRSDKVHAWSFHTVEEFDEMMERIHFSRVKQTGFAGKDEGFSQLHHSKSSSYSFEHAEQAIKQLPSTDESQVEENTATEEDIFSSSRAQTTGVIQSPNSSRTAKGSDVVAHAAQNLDKGFRRKAMANELESLKMPTTIEFQGAAILQKFLHVGGQVYSPGAYVTPKFGGYSLPNDSGPVNKYTDGTIFDPELVAATEKAMEQLELEEENILKQIEENFKGEARLIGD